MTEHDIYTTLQSVKVLTNNFLYTFTVADLLPYRTLQSVHLELLHVVRVPWCWGRETRSWGWIPWM